MSEPDVSSSEPIDDPTYSDTLGAAFRLENFVVSDSNRRELLNSQYKSPLERSNDLTNFDEDFQPLASIKGTRYEGYAHEFFYADSIQQVNAIKQGIDRELVDRQTLENSSGFAAFSSQVLAGLASPEVLIPGGQAVTGIRLGTATLKTAAKVGAVAGASTVPTEILLHNSQHTRTLDESIVNIGATTLLGGILGGSAKYIGDKVISGKAGRELRDRLMSDLGLEDIKKIKVKLDGSINVDELSVALNKKQEEFLKSAEKAPDPTLLKQKVEAIESLKKELAEAKKPLEAPTQPKDIKQLTKDFKSRFMGEGVPARKAKKLATKRANELFDKTAKVFQRDVKDLEVRQELHTKNNVKPLEENIAKQEVELNQLQKQTDEAGEAQGKLVALNKMLREDGISMDLAKKFINEEDIPLNTKNVYVSEPKVDNHKFTEDGAEEVHRTLSSAGAVDFDESGTKLVNAFGFLKSSKFLSPLMRLTQSVSPRTRDVFEELGSDRLLRRHNLDGVARRQSAEEGKKLKRGQMASALRYAHAQLRAARLSMKEKGLDASELTEDYFFNTVTRYLRKGGEVSKESPAERAMANTAEHIRKNVLEKYQKELVDLDLIDGGKLIKNYVPQLWHKNALVSNPVGAKKLLTKLITHYRKNRTDTDIDELGEAEELYAKLTGLNAGDLDVELEEFMPLSGVPSRLKDRHINIPDFMLEEFEEFLHNDIEYIMKAQFRSLAGYLEVAKRFGSIENLETRFSEINADYDELKVKDINTNNGAKVKRLENLQQRDIEDLKSLVNGVIENGTPIHINFARIRSLNYISKLGGMTISAFTDLARPIAAYGMRRYTGHLLKMAVNWKSFKASAEELEKAGVAADMFLTRRLNGMMDGSDRIPMAVNKFDRALESLEAKFGRLTGMDYWNHGMKRMTGTLSQDSMIKDIADVYSGKGSKRAVARLANLGIEQSDLAKITKELQREGVTVTDSGLKVIDYDLMKDQALADRLRTAIVTEVDTVINTPSLASVPRVVAENGFAKLVFQFKSFLVASHQQTLLPGLQAINARAGGMEFMGNMVGATGLGFMVYTIKDYLRQGGDVTWEEHIDKVTSNPTNSVAEAVDHSGMLTVLMEMNNIGDKFGAPSMQSALGTSSSRFTNRNKWGAVLGASANFTGDAIDVATAMANPNKEWTQSQTRAARRNLPMQNLFYVRSLFDWGEQGYNEHFGVPKYQKRNSNRKKPKG